MLVDLNLPNFEFKFKNEGQSKQIFDDIRKKFVALTPEEWVRQNFVQYLIKIKGYPKALTSIEHSLNYNTLKKRSDIVVFTNERKPILIVECKRPSVKINQKTIDQVIQYNSVLRVPYIAVTNGYEHYCLYYNSIEHNISFLEDIPSFKKAINNF